MSTEIIDVKLKITNDRFKSRTKKFMEFVSGEIDEIETAYSVSLQKIKNITEVLESAQKEIEKLNEIIEQKNETISDLEYKLNDYDELLVSAKVKTSEDIDNIRNQIDESKEAFLRNLEIAAKIVDSWTPEQRVYNSIGYPEQYAHKPYEESSTSDNSVKKVPKTIRVTTSFRR